MQKKIIVNSKSTEKRLAILEENKVVELLVDQPVNYPRAGDIYLSKVEKVLPGMQSAFVELGYDKNGYLYKDDTKTFALNSENEDIGISQCVKQGQTTIVQIAKEGSGTKGPKLSEIIELSGRYLVYMPHGSYVAVSKKIKSEAIREQWRMFGESLLENEEGIILRTACEKATEQEVSEELLYLRKLWQMTCKQVTLQKPPAKLYEEDRLVERFLRNFSMNDVSEIVIDDENEYQQLCSIFESSPTMLEKIKLYRQEGSIFSTYNIETEIERALKKIVWLKSGGFLTIEKTEACTIIDVNTGKFIGKQNFQETKIVTNLEAAREIAHQLRLRDIGGIILIDFINMKEKSAEAKVKQELINALKNDRTSSKVFHFTALGILEMTRKKVRQSLLDTLASPCHCCNGVGFVPSVSTTLYQLERELLQYTRIDEEAIWMEVSEQIYEVLKTNKKHMLNDIKKKVPFELVVSLNATFKDTHFEIKQIGSIENIKSRIDTNPSI